MIIENLISAVQHLEGEEGVRFTTTFRHNREVDYRTFFSKALHKSQTHQFRYLAKSFQNDFEIVSKDLLHKCNEIRVFQRALDNLLTTTRFLTVFLNLNAEWTNVEFHSLIESFEQLIEENDRIRCDEEFVENIVEMRAK